MLYGRLFRALAKILTTVARVSIAFDRYRLMVRPHDKILPIDAVSEAQVRVLGDTDAAVFNSFE